jgi:hypothetical protein
MPLVNVYNNYGKSPFLMGKLTISMAIIFQFAKCFRNPFLQLQPGSQAIHRDRPVPEERSSMGLATNIGTGEAQHKTYRFSDSLFWLLHRSMTIGSLNIPNYSFIQHLIDCSRCM